MHRLCYFDTAVPWHTGLDPLHRPLGWHTLVDIPMRTLWLLQEYVATHPVVLQGTLMLPLLGVRRVSLQNGAVKWEAGIGKIAC